MNKKWKQIILLFALTIFFLPGCSKEDEYTKFQSAYFEISSKAKNDETFSKSYLESILETNPSKSNYAENKGDYNAFIFEVNDEILKVFLNSNNKLAYIEYEKLGEIILVNNLEKNSYVGEYEEGFTSEFKLDSLEEQKKSLII